MIGSFTRLLVATFLYDIGYSVATSFFTDTGFTMFGLVEQDYKLPKETLNQIGVEIFDYDKYEL